MKNARIFLVQQFRDIFFSTPAPRFVTFLLRLALWTQLGRTAVLKLISIDAPSSALAKRISKERPRLIRGIIKCLPNRAQSLDSLIETAKKRYNSSEKQVCFESYMLILVSTQKYLDILNELNMPKAAPLLNTPIARYAYRYAQFEIGNYQSVNDSALELTQIDPASPVYRLMLDNADFLRTAYAAGMSTDKPRAIWCFGHQYNLTVRNRDFDEQAVESIKQKLLEHFLITQGPTFLKSALNGEKVGIFLLHAPQALGHAILDPYHYLSMHQGKYDRIYFIGGSLDSYSPGSRACVEIVEQYGEYLATTSDIIFNLSWMSMGQIKIGNIEITIENYWSLLREVCQRTEATDDPFAINSWHVDLPPHYQAIGEQFCEYHNIDLSKPIITLHARNHGYHALAKQEFRNAPIKDYVPAIQYLLDSGYQVVRLGDAKMPKLDIRDRGYFEIPNMAHYENGLDPFFIKRSVFLIGSQSGPCSYARALGIPVLSINAVFSYTLLPAVLEMACFKRYSIRDDNGAERFLNYEEILDRDIFKIESQFQFERQGISFTNCTSQEIIAAVKDMLEWVVCPEMALSPEQDTFKRLTMQTSARLKNATDTNPAIADYLGIALPGYRISTTVEKLRAAPITSAEPTGNAA